MAETGKKGGSSTVKKKQSTPPRNKQITSSSQKEEDKPKPNKLYNLGKWKEFTQYRCKFCPFDSLRERDIIQHIASRHAPHIRDTGLVASDGKQILVEEG